LSGFPPPPVQTFARNSEFYPPREELGNNSSGSRTPSVAPSVRSSTSYAPSVAPSVRSSTSRASSVVSSRRSSRSHAHSESHSHSHSGSRAPSVAPSHRPSGSRAPSVAPSNHYSGSCAPSVAPSHHHSRSRAPSVAPSERSSRSSRGTDLRSGDPQPRQQVYFDGQVNHPQPQHPRSTLLAEQQFTEEPEEMQNDEQSYHQETYPNIPPPAQYNSPGLSNLAVEGYSAGRVYVGPPQSAPGVYSPSNSNDGNGGYIQGTAVQTWQLNKHGPSRTHHTQHVGPSYIQTDPHMNNNREDSGYMSGNGGAGLDGAYYGGDNGSGYGYS